MVGKYQLGRTLGQGTFGKVKFATDTQTGRHVAVKVMDKAAICASNMGGQIKREISSMKLINHPSVIQFIEILATSTTIYIILELVTGGELFDKIVEKGCFAEEEARKYYHQLIGGIEHCHAAGVVHRDLKPENLLLDEANNLKISDFGLSALSSDRHDDLFFTTCGTPNYVAPEVLMDKGYDGKAADVWSSGVILYVLLCGFLPFDESTMVELFRKIVKADFAYPATLSPEAIALLAGILNPDPEKRTTIPQIKRSAWYRGITLEAWGPEKRDDEKERQDALGVSGSKHRRSIPSDDASSRAAASPAPSGAPTSGDSQPIIRVDDKTRAISESMKQGITSASCSGHSQALNPQLGAGGSSANNSPLVGSFQGRRNTAGGTNSLAGAPGFENTDPLSLDEEEVEMRGPIPLNAFDLVNMVGGAAMGRMFQRSSDKTNPVKIHFTQFTTKLPVDEIMTKLDQVLASCVDTEYRIYSLQCCAKAARSTARGKILGVCQIYRMTPTLFMVEWRKLKGDVFLFHDFFNEVCAEGGFLSMIGTVLGLLFPIIHTMVQEREFVGVRFCRRCGDKHEFAVDPSKSLNSDGHATTGSDMNSSSTQTQLAVLEAPQQRYPLHPTHHDSAQVNM